MARTELEEQRHARLKHYTKQVRDNEKSTALFLEALLVIRDEHLYKLEGLSWEGWCEKHCELSFRHINRLMAKRRERALPSASSNNKTDKEKEDTHTGTERVALGSQSKEPAPTTLPAAARKAPLVYDNEGNELKWEALKFWERRIEVKELLATFANFKIALDRMLDPHDPLWHEINFSMLEARLEELGQILRCAMPHAICPECYGAPSTRGSRCGCCGNKGLISRTLWNVAVSEEKKQIMARTAKGQK